MSDHWRERHLAAQVAALPPGPAWDGFRDADGRGRALLYARAGAPADVSAAIDRWTAEYLPWTAVDTIGSREAEAGLPDPCRGPAPTLAARQARIRAVWTAVGGQSRAYFTGLANDLGIPITITEYKRRTHGLSRHGERYGDDDWNFVWRVTGPLDGYRHRLHGDRHGEPYATWTTNALRCVFERVRHRHRHLIYSLMETS